MRNPGTKLRQEKKLMQHTAVGMPPTTTATLSCHDRRRRTIFAVRYRQRPWPVDQKLRYLAFPPVDQNQHHLPLSAGGSGGAVELLTKLFSVDDGSRDTKSAPWLKK